MTRWRVMPLRKVLFTAGVIATPSLANQRLALANSATLPLGSSIAALSAPRSAAQAEARAPFGYRQAALASVGAMSVAARRKGASMAEKPAKGGSGASYSERMKSVLSGSGRAAPSPLRMKNMGRT